MQTLEELNKIVKQTLDTDKDLVNKCHNTKLSIGDKIIIYLISQGITDVYAYSEEDEEEFYHKSLESFFSNEEHRVKYEGLVLQSLSFLVWIKKQCEPERIILNRKYIKKQSLETPHFINRIWNNQSIVLKDKVQILLNSYASLLENFKNILQEDILKNICKKISIKTRGYISLGNFREILDKFEEECHTKSLSTIINISLRNAINHANYELSESGIIYEYNGKQTKLSLQELNEKLIELSITIQFFILFYIRLFRSKEEIIHSDNSPI
jgi:hypothetical protein